MSREKNCLSFRYTYYFFCIEQTDFICSAFGPDLILDHFSLKPATNVSSLNLESSGIT